MGAIFVLSYIIGNKIDRHYKKRADYYNNLFEFVRHAEREITLLKSDIVTIMSDYIKGMNSNQNIVFQDVLNSISNNDPIRINANYLNENEKREVESFFEGFAKIDSNNQEKFFKRHEDFAINRVELSRKQKKEKGELGKKLCILAGIVLIIVII